MGRVQRERGGGDASPAWSTHPPERSQHRMTPRCQGPGGSDFAADAASKSERGLFGPEEHSPISHTQSLPSPLPPPCWASDWVRPTHPHPTHRQGRLALCGGLCRLSILQDWRAAIWKRSLLTRCCQIACSLCQGAADRQTDRQTACFMSALHFSRGFSGAKGNSSGLPLVVNLGMDALPPALPPRIYQRCLPSETHGCT